MAYSYNDYEKSAAYLRAELGDFKPEILMILGSGLGDVLDDEKNPVISDRRYVDYRNIPNFKVSTAPDHKGRFIFGQICGKSVAVMQGRLHCYEGYSMEDVAYPVRVLKLLGADKMIITNAAGCVNTLWHVGDLMLINDHIRLFGFGPLNGPNIEQFGPRFNDMTTVYAPDYQDLARRKAAELGITLRDGVYMYFPGPQFETPAEVRAARVLGADAVGMSTVPEATVAAHCGMHTLGITVLTNMAAGVLKQRISGAEVNEAAARASKDFIALIKACLAEM